MYLYYTLTFYTVPFILIASTITVHVYMYIYNLFLFPFFFLLLYSQDGVNVKIKDISVEGAQMSRWALFGSLFIERTQLFYEIMQHLWIKELSSSPLALFERF